MCNNGDKTPTNMYIFLLCRLRATYIIVTDMERNILCIVSGFVA